VRRGLRLHKETLTELSAGELAEVNGGSDTCITYTVIPTGCVCSGIYPSLNVDCNIAVTGRACAE